MRGALAIAVLLAVVSVALVAVCEHSEVCRLEYRVWEVERRRHSLERQLREMDAALADTLTPRSLLEEADRHAARGIPLPRLRDIRPPPNAMPRAQHRLRAPRPSRHAFRDRRWFDEGGR